MNADRDHGKREQIRAPAPTPADAEPTTPVVAYDPVRYPAHYCKGRRYEPIDVIEDWELGFCLGNAVKYISRAGRKGDALTDLRKATWYLDREIAKLAGEAEAKAEAEAAKEISRRLREHFANGGTLTADVIIPTEPPAEPPAWREAVIPACGLRSASRPEPKPVAEPEAEAEEPTPEPEPAEPTQNVVARARLAVPDTPPRTLDKRKAFILRALACSDSDTMVAMTARELTEAVGMRPAITTDIALVGKALLLLEKEGLVARGNRATPVGGTKPVQYWVLSARGVKEVQ